MLFREAIQNNSLTDNIFQNTKGLTSRGAKAFAIIALEMTSNFASIFKSCFSWKKRRKSGIINCEKRFLLLLDFLNNRRAVDRENSAFLEAVHDIMRSEAFRENLA